LSAGSRNRLPAARTIYEALLELIGDARIVLLGEASHGTHEFYSERTAITERVPWNQWNA
jgi:erythromycin esterase-like protein